MPNFVYPLLSVILVSLVSFIGVLTLFLNPAVVRRYVFVLVSLAVGALLGDSFLHLLPEAFAQIADTRLLSLLVIAGILLFFILEKLLHWHHHTSECDTPHPVGSLVIVSDGVHNFIDGLVLGASFLVSNEVGLATTIAVVLHEIPQEIGDFGVLLHAGFSKSKALWFNFLSAILAVAGVLAVFLLGEWASTLAIWLLPVSAGGFIYIAMADLLPELNKTKVPRYMALQLLAITIGIGAMLAL